MSFELPVYHHPDFAQPCFTAAPDARWQAAERDGIAPEDFHSTSMYPEYCKIDGQWRLAEESRMDACIVLRPDGRLDTVEARNLKQGDRVLLGRTERCEEGIYLHCICVFHPDLCLMGFQSPWAANVRRTNLTLIFPGQVRLKVRSIPVRDAAPCLNALEQET